MKNVVLGIIGCLIVLYTAMLGLSVYNMTVRENQMEKSLSLALSGAMNRYYEPNMYIVDKKPVSSYDVEKAVIEDINERLTAGGTAIATVYVCDMEKGIISARIDEDVQHAKRGKNKKSCKHNKKKRAHKKADMTKKTMKIILN